MNQYSFPIKHEREEGMKFQKGNKIVYGQDMGWQEGIPEDVDFEVSEVMGNKLKLVADGYGNLKKKDAYGNGAIYVYLQEMHRKEKVKCDKCEGDGFVSK